MGVGVRVQILSESLTEQMVIHIQSAVEQRDPMPAARTIPLAALIAVVGEMGSPETAQGLETAAGEVRARHGMGGARNLSAESQSQVSFAWLGGWVGQAGVEGGVCIEYADFLVAVTQLCQVERQENLFRAFSLFDQDLSGFITETEMEQACSEINIPDTVMGELVAEVNRDEVDRAEGNMTEGLTDSEGGGLGLGLGFRRGASTITSLWR